VRFWRFAATVTALAMASGLAGAAPPVDESSSATVPADVVGLGLEGEAACQFLRTAQVTKLTMLGTGVTRPVRVTLTDGVRTLRGIWKTVDEHERGLMRMESGGFEVDFRDSWKHEIAAYELSRLLGLDLVPPTVERELGGRHGSLQMWVEHAMTEKERLEKALNPVHPPRWAQQIHCIRLFHQLTYNTDFRNVENVLLDSSFRVYLIDSSRAFRIQKDLLAPDDLQCFSRRVLDRLRQLDRPTLEEHLGRWLDGLQIEALLARRDRILAIVDQRVARHGQGQVLFY